MLFSAASGCAAAWRFYIFLHALRYSTSLGVLEIEMTEWAAEGWKWQRASGGGSIMYLVYLYVLLSRMQITA